MLEMIGKKRQGVIESPNNFANFENPSPKKGLKEHKV
jgi:hypothetical protein